MANEVATINGVELGNIGAFNNVSPDNIAAINHTQFVILIPPDPPTGLNLTQDAGSVQGSWNAVSGATEYEYRISTDDEETWLEPVSTGTNTNFDTGDQGFPSTTVVYVQVRVTTSSGTSDWSASASIVIT